MQKEEAIEMTGTVMQAHGNTNFRVQVGEYHNILAKVGGRMRRHRIRVMPQDRVKVHVSPYDLHRGRIVYRFRR